VLGYGKLDLLGVSYGTRLALTIMRDFPDAVRSAVLDSTVPLQANLIEDNGVNFQRSFKLFFAACAADPSCNAKSPTLQADYLAIIAQLNDQPVTTMVTDMRTKKRTPAVIDGNGLTFLISEMLYDETATSYIPLLINQVKGGKTEALNLLLSVFGVTGSDINVGAYFSTLCSEEVPFNNRDRAAAAATSLTPELQELFVNDVREHFDVCAQWPTLPVNPAETQPVASDLPALVLSSDNDPATPPSYGEQTAQTLSKGFLIAFPGVGHSVLSNGGDCGMNTIFAFINDPTTTPSTDCVGKKTS
jgi:pimeloyl-ACP methyl ester carboxylesterase